MARRIKIIALSVLSIFLGLSAISPPAVGAEIGVTGTTLISASPAGDPGDERSTNATMSPDGRFIAFMSSATNFVPGVNDSFQVYVYDKQLQTMELASRSTEGVIGDGSSSPEAISADGRFVLFSSSATNLSSDYFDPPSPGVPSYLYLRDRQAQTTVRVGLPPITPIVDRASMSDDGNIIAYVEQDSNLYIYNRSTGATIHLPGPPSSNPSVSANGQYVAYRTATDDGQGNFIRDGRRYEIATGNTVDFAIEADFTTGPTISPDGQYAVYFAKQPGHSDVYFEHIGTQQIEVLTSTSGEASRSLSISADNRFVSYRATETELEPVFVRYIQAWVADRTTGQKVLVDSSINNLGANTSQQLSADGTQLVFNPLHSSGKIQIVIAQLGELDSTAPIISDPTFNPNPKTVSDSSVGLSAQVTDDVSGIASVEYYDSVQETWLPMSLEGATAATTISTPAAEYPAGSYEFNVRATDGAGNEATESVHLYIYSPASNTFGLGRIAPNGSTSEPGDNLPSVPGNAVGQFVFAVTYAGGAAATPTGASTFTYGANCLLPWSNCFRMTTSSFDWLIINNNTSTFQGIASLTLGSQNLGSDFVVRVTATNGTAGLPDHYLFQVYGPNANPETATPLYQASGNVTLGVIF